MNKNSQVQSLRDRLKNIAKLEGKPIASVVTDFLIERMVCRLTSNSILATHIVFKGGYVGIRCYQSPRYTVDLDVIAHKRDEEEVIELAKLSMKEPMDDLVWFQLEKEIDLTTQGNYGGTCLQYRAGIGKKPDDTRRSQILKVDIGVGDPVTPGPVKSFLECKVEGGVAAWQVYPIETIVAEKIHCLIARGASNSRSKDIFDLAFYCPKCEPHTLRKALIATFSHRGDDLPQDLYETIRVLETDVLQRG
ncbi:MAG: nucleotidyl transferase AbiEii/AbiGii toxin family protein [Bdellovibrionota bacterium]